MAYIPLYPEMPVRVDCLYSLHYFRFREGYDFPGEAHDFWELVYVDMGAMTCVDGEETLSLTPGQCRLHAPNVFHTLRADLSPRANVFIISFGARSPELHRLCGQTLTLDTDCRRCAQRIVTEGQALFGPVLDITYQNELRPLPTAHFGGGQLVTLELERLLVLLLRQLREADGTVPRGMPLSSEEDALSVIAVAERYMRAHLDGSARIAEIGRGAGVSPATLKRVFREQLDTTVMDRYRGLRIEEACRRLRTGRVNVSQAAYEMGYSSLPAFSRQFKQVMGITPTEYTLLINDSAMPGREKDVP